MFILAIISLVLVFKHYGEGLPNYRQLKEYKPMITTRIYAADDSLITEFSKEKRIFIPIHLIPKNVINAFLAAEDSNFYNHFGIDIVAIIRTAMQNLSSSMSGEDKFGGASTITQQVVKNFLLTNDRTIERKIKEAILAIRMSRNFSKEQVLELYLNQIYLGSGSYGVAAAAQSYFDKSISELEIEEIAVLATLPKAPSRLDPRKNIEKAKIRRDWVISRMVEEGFINNVEGDIAIQKPIKLTENQDNSITEAHFFADSVKKRLTQMYGSDDVFENGISVKTTLKPDLQIIAQEALQNGIEKYDVKHGYRGPLAKIKNIKNWRQDLEAFTPEKDFRADWTKAAILKVVNDKAFLGTSDGKLGFITLNNLKWAQRYIDTDKKGEVPNFATDVLNVGDIILVEEDQKHLMMQDGVIEEKSGDESDFSKYKRSFFLKQIPEVNGSFIAMDPHTGRILAMSGAYIDARNQFNRATQAFRQTGSTMKPFGYIAALENGFTPASIVIDEEISLDQGPDLPPYKPTNYSDKFYGPTTLRVGLEKSRNVTTVRMAQQVGLDEIAKTIKKFGINDDPQPIYSLVLGSSETNLIKLATAYSMIVNGGKKIIPEMIEKIQDRNGKIIHRRDTRVCSYCKLDINQNTDIKNIAVPFLEDIKEPIIDPATAYQITYMLQGVVDRGTAIRARSVDKIIGGKTGTTNNSYDSWFAGFSPDLVAAVYIGFDNPKSLGSKETGSSLALPVFIDFMKKALKDKPSTPFRIPSSVKFVKIDRNTGKIATPKTPRENIFFEAFKLSDSILREDEYKEDTRGEDIDPYDSRNINSTPMGIY